MNVCQVNKYHTGSDSLLNGSCKIKFLISDKISWELEKRVS